MGLLPNSSLIRHDGPYSQDGAMDRALLQALQGPWKSLLIHSVSWKRVTPQILRVGTIVKGLWVSKTLQFLRSRRNTYLNRNSGITSLRRVKKTR